MNLLRVVLMTLSVGMLSCLGPQGSRAQQPVVFGDTFPDLILQTPVGLPDRDYLGLPAAGTFTPSQIQADVVLVELLNVHCPHCQMQVPSYNELYQLIADDPAWRDRIKFIGIAVGNTPDEVARFRQNFNISFPIISDAGFLAYRAVGGSGTPFSIYLRQDRPGVPGVVAGTHLGLNTHYQKLYDELRSLADQEVAALRREGRHAEVTRNAIADLYPEEDLQYRVRTAVLENLQGIMSTFDRLDLRSGRRVYMARLRDGEQLRTVFAEVVSRSSICDICHDLHFIYLFDPTGKVLAFVPLQATKYGNVNWNTADVDKMRRRVVGRSLTSPAPFDPKVDAVTAATITSAMIFDSLNQGQSLLQELREKGLL